jgi:prepilin-type N-terminal cleavage/methylation domain-containing protein
MTVNPNIDIHLETLPRPAESERARRVASCRGFSLIEIMMVMAISLIVLKMSLPMINSTIISFRLGSAASSLAGAIQSYRYKAISVGCPISIAVSSQTFQIAAESLTTTAPPTCSTTFTNDVAGATQYSTSDISLNAPVTLFLNPNGTLTTSAASIVPANFSLILSPSNGASTKTVTVSGVGNVKITAP